MVHQSLSFTEGKIVWKHIEVKNEIMDRMKENKEIIMSRKCHAVLYLW